MSLDWSTLTQVLVTIQSGLDGDLALAPLAASVGLSPWQLQRGFQAALGESPKAYVERLRLERAAFRMLVQDASLTEIALDCGYQAPETFARAFRRRYGQSPQQWRLALWQRLAATPEPAPGRVLEPRESGLSQTRLVRLHSLHLAAIRHLGPYESVPESMFDRLSEWADQRRIPLPRRWLGIGHDAPGMVPAAQLRFDAALVVGAPFEPDGDLVHRVLPAMDVALTTHVGPYTSLPAAYARILPRLLADPRWTVVGLPAIEFYHCARVSVHAALNRESTGENAPAFEPVLGVPGSVNHTDICLPVALRT